MIWIKKQFNLIVYGNSSNEEKSVIQQYIETMGSSTFQTSQSTLFELVNAVQDLVMGEIGGLTLQKAKMTSIQQKEAIQPGSLTVCIVSAIEEIVIESFHDLGRRVMFYQVQVSRW